MHIRLPLPKWFPRSGPEALFSLAFLLFPGALFKVSAFGLPLYPLEILLFAILLLVMVERKGRGTLAVFREEALLLLGIASFLLGGTLALLAHPLTEAGLGQWKSWILLPPLFLLAGALVSEKLRPTYLLFSWLAGALLLALPAWLALLTGRLTYDGRLAFPETSPNFLAELLGPGLLIALFFLFCSRRWNQTLLWVSLSALLALPFIKTRSYGAFFALLCALPFMISLLQKRVKQNPSGRRSIFLVAVLLVALGATLLFQEYGSAKFESLLLGSERSSLSSRVMIWRSAGAILSEHPLLGIGVGRFQEEYLGHQALFPPYLEWAVPEPHNLFLAFWLSAGALGAFGLLLMGGWAFSALASSQASRETPPLQALLVFVLAFGLFDTPYFRNDLSALFFLLLFLIFLNKKAPAPGA
jgi:O-antigen ligase